ncbi:hypothetical protein DUNSADRAFT_15667 [Dunaliella salina]|uniref:Encoded protein n=1 Tax=Dunaliella salina TaxID=3046 RepID=A0ABQ7G4Y8_DUNSA|nr:hypothetical protein DUNSADRAFT_15667 [Dunaliella salina]|eukprot:KAF5829668.1 hypothetical protein DUNSADRAFT_15667 [Dunaliella salina]
MTIPPGRAWAYGSPCAKHEPAVEALSTAAPHHPAATPRLHRPSSPAHQQDPGRTDATAHLPHLPPKALCYPCTSFTTS